MDAEKKQLVEDFNIERFLEWQSQFYEARPEWLKSKIEAHNNRVWEAFQTKQEIPELDEAAQKAVDDYDNRKMMVEVWDSMGIPLMAFSTLKGIKSNVKMGIERDIEEVQQKIQNGVSNQQAILQTRLEYGCELIDFDLLQWVMGERPLTEQQGVRALQTFWEVGVCQWILKELAAENKGAKGSQPLQQAEELPDPLKWEGKSLGLLYLLFAQLQVEAFLDKENEGGHRQIARWLKPMFNLTADEITIAEQIGKMAAITSKDHAKRLPKGGREIVELVKWLKEVDGK